MPTGFVVNGDTRINTYLVRSDGTLAGALRAFGQPTSRKRNPRAAICAVNWRAHGMLIAFYSLSGKNPCAGQTGRFGSALLTGSRWRTARGLRIGAPAAVLKRRYPRAQPGRGPGWRWLLRRQSRIGSHGLEARVERGRVTAFRITHAGGGE
jgi:hypothetical protein